MKANFPHVTKVTCCFFRVCLRERIRGEIGRGGGRREKGEGREERNERREEEDILEAKEWKKREEMKEGEGR